MTLLQLHSVSLLQKNPQTFLGLLYTASELTLLPRVPKCHVGPQVRVEVPCRSDDVYILLLFAEYSIFSPCSAFKMAEL